MKPQHRPFVALWLGLHQIEENLLGHVESAIRFQIRHDGLRVRSQILHFTTIEDAPGLVKTLSN